jgi:hypothetical protein
MIYADKCFKCPNRSQFIEPEIDKAKEFYSQYQSSWIFPCGAYYNHNMLNTLGVEIAPGKCILQKENQVANILEDLKQMFNLDLDSSQ